MPELNLKDRFFTHSLRSLDRVLRPPPKAYICPICFELFTDINKLSKEHVPPKSTGGKIICLTCKQCNSITGHSIDYALSREKSFHNLGVAGSSPHRIKFEYKGHTLNASLRRDSDGMKIEILPGQNNPKTNESVHEELKKCNWGETTFDIKVSGAFKRHTADVAHLKSAYLAAFAKFGYRWLFTSSTDIIREQIQNPERKIIEGARTYIKDTNDQEYSFGLAEKPFPFLFALMGESAVFLPWLEQDSNELYSWTKESRANDKPLKFRFIDKWTWPESMELALDQL